MWGMGGGCARFAVHIIEFKGILILQVFFAALRGAKLWRHCRLASPQRLWPDRAG